MTKSTITRERIQRIIRAIDSEAYDEEEIREWLSSDEIMELARMALSAMDSEPEYLPLDYLQGQKDGLEWAAQLAEANHPETGDWLYDDPIELAKAIRKGPDMPPEQPAADSEPDRNPVLAYADSYRDMAKQGVESVPIWSVITDLERNIAPLYRHAQPAPVVPDEKDKTVDADDHPLLWSFNEGWNACRAAMLQAGTLTNEGTKQAWTGIPDIDNAINMLDRIDTLDSCDDDRIEAVKTVLRRLAGNSPVIPDGYVMVPKEMTDEIGEAIAMQANCCGGIALDIYDAILAAAQQSSGSEPATVPGKWIPVSEQMPDDDDFVYIWPRPDFGVELHVGQYCERSHKGGGWYAQVYEQNHGIEWHPITVTHWMQLPAAPQEVK
ncbi:MULTISPECIES: DUF551 domain-containing protein [Klebsiella]|nr:MULTISPECIES: DUF551 domain-containing protein [Klebsiella]MDK1763159.1 DUF551 domain-containing protein [Klebsiella pneumoniae]MDK1789550.1 DUF551 domain-containing protein [Klebsiella pneumoniae]MDK1800141.1 DUF551 domain-containing protein [Klebsiella pneumoniae]MDK1821427.1 DUF551 domain-containing protein [Klebsiella sp. K6-148]MDK1832083.1 DUF551 domain-containing protein [Klebsiella sp. K5-212]